MKMNGEQLIPASREAVWEALNDAAILKQSIAGCTELEKTSATQFAAKVTAKVGPVKAKFSGDVKLSKLKPPVSYVISGQGKGGAAGFAKGGATVKLEEKDGQTLLTYDVDAQVGGKLAQIGSRLIQSTARKMADDFFKKFAKLVTEIPAKPAAKTKKTAAEKSATKKSPAAASAPKSATKVAAAATKKVRSKSTAARTAAMKKTAAAKKSAVKNTAAVEKAVTAGVTSTSEAVAAKVADAKAEVSAVTKSAVPPQPAPAQSSGSNLWWVAGGIVLGLVVVYLLTR